MKVMKVVRSTYVLNGNFTIKRPFYDSYIATVDAKNLQGGEYRRYAKKTVTRVCSDVVMNPSFETVYEDVQKYSNIPKWGTCPFPAVSFFLIENILSITLIVFRAHTT